jgi:hypothetical protein
MLGGLGGLGWAQLRHGLACLCQPFINIHGDSALGDLIGLAGKYDTQTNSRINETEVLADFTPSIKHRLMEGVKSAFLQFLPVPSI